MKAELRVLGLLLTAVTVAAAEMRTWTFEASGRVLEGEVAGFTDNAVTLKCADGKTVSVPIAYLAKKDRLYLVAEQAKQWHEVEVLKLEDVEPGGRYKKCTVRGTGSNGEIYIERLPTSVEAVLHARKQQAAPITALSDQIEGQKRAVQEAKAAIPSGASGNRYSRRAVASERAQLKAATRNLGDLEANRSILQKAYDDSVQKTRAQTIVKMRNTGVVYKALPLWECFDPRKPKP